MLKYAFLGQTIYMLCQFGVLSAIAHLRGPEAVGAFGLALAIATPVFVLTNSGLRTVQSADQKSGFSFAEYAGFRLRTTALGFGVAVAAAAVLANSHTVFMVSLLYAAAKAFESVSELSYGSFERALRTDLVFRSLVLRGLASVALFVILLGAGVSLWLAFLAQLAVWSAIALALDLPAACRLNATRARDIGISASRFRSLVRQALPVGIASFAVGIQYSILRFLVEGLLGLRALGIFVSVSYIYQAGSQLANAAGYTLTARFSIALGQGDEGLIRRTIRQGAVLIGLLTLAGLAVALPLGDGLLALAFGPEVRGHAGLLIIVGIALSFRLLSAAPNSRLFASGGAVNIFRRECGLVVLTLVSGYLLTRRFGLEGAAVALMLVALARLAMTWVEARLWRPRQI